jgi:protein tyrosine/serine phosphatase
MHARFHSLVATFALLGSMAVAQAENAVPATNTANPDTTFDKARFTREVTQSPDLPNFHEVHPFLFRSGEPTQAGLSKLSEHNIKTIIDLRAPTGKALQEKEWAGKLGIKYINLPMSSEAPTSKQVETFLKETKEAQAHPDKGAVLVHCAHGSDRTGCMVGIWRVSQEGWTYPQAYKEMRHYWFTPKFTKLSDAVQKHAAGRGSQSLTPAPTGTAKAN